MIPVVCDVASSKHQMAIAKKVYKEVCAKYGVKRFGQHLWHDD